MLNRFSRTQLLFGSEAMERLSQCRVAVFGMAAITAVLSLFGTGDKGLYD